MNSGEAIEVGAFTWSSEADAMARAVPANKAKDYGTSMATRVDPDSSARAESQKLVDMLFGVAPSLIPKVETMLATSTPPSF
jgi:hypothetical protein